MNEFTLFKKGKIMIKILRILLKESRSRKMIDSPEFMKVTISEGSSDLLVFKLIRPNLISDRNF